MNSLLELLFALFLVRLALGQEEHNYDDYEDAPFGVIGSLVIWAILLAAFVIWCLLIGLGLALGLAILAGLLFIFGAGGVVTSLVGLAATRKPRVGWRIFCIWIHAGCLLAAGAVFGGFVVPMAWPDIDFWTGTGLGAIAGLGAGTVVGWLFAVASERFVSLLKEFVFRRFKGNTGQGQ